MGIIPTALAERNISGVTVGEELQVSSMYGQIGKMILNADAFIALLLQLRKCYPSVGSLNYSPR